MSFEKIAFKKIFQNELRQALAEERERVDFLQLKHPNIPRHLLGRLGRKRCNCRGRNFDLYTDGMPLSRYTLPANAKALVEGMHSTQGVGRVGDEFFSNGHHLSLIFNANTQQWCDVYVCECPGLEPAISPYAKDRASGRD